MKGIIRLFVLIACGTALFTHVSAQERSNQITPTYQFEFRLASKGDTVTTLYCVLKEKSKYPVLSNFMSAIMTKPGSIIQKIS